VAVPEPNLPIPSGAIAAAIAVLVAVGGVAGVLHDAHLKAEDVYKDTVYFDLSTSVLSRLFALRKSVVLKFYP